MHFSLVSETCHKVTFNSSQWLLRNGPDKRCTDRNLKGNNSLKNHQLEYVDNMHIFLLVELSVLAS